MAGLVCGLSKFQGTVHSALARDERVGCMACTSSYVFTKAVQRTSWETGVPLQQFASTCVT